MIIRKTFKTAANWTKLLLTFALLNAMFILSAAAQTNFNQPMDAKSVASLIKELKEVVSKNTPDEKDSLLVGEKWDKRKDLTGKAKKDVINLLYNDVKSVITDSGVQYQIYSIFSAYKQMPDESPLAEAQKSAQLKSYAKMTENEKAAFIAGKIDEITTKISGKTYAFNTDFKLRVAKYVDGYAKRVGNNRKTPIFAEDLVFVLQRGSEAAPTINKACDKNGVARLAALYIAMVEAEFDANIKGSNGSLGMFQIDTSRAQKYGLSSKDRAAVEKAADLTAHYLKDNQKYFAQNKMNEFLAILSWNRDAKKIKFDLNFKFMADSENMACPICGLTANPTRFDEQFQLEAVRYIPKFLAAAIVGENPRDFGLSTKPLSTFGAETSH